MKKEKYYYFTFGVGSPLKGRYIKLFGTHETTRSLMFEIFGDKWTFQYDSLEKCGAQIFNYKELELNIPNTKEY
jgi:hypothetical protein